MPLTPKAAMDAMDRPAGPEIVVRASASVTLAWVTHAPSVPFVVFVDVSMAKVAFRAPPGWLTRKLTPERSPGWARRWSSH